VENFSKEKLGVLEQIEYIFLKSSLGKQAEIIWYFHGTSKILTQNCFESFELLFFFGLCTVCI